VLFILCFVTVVFLVDVPDTCLAKSEAADKTEVNQEDQGLTADQQGNTKSDREITRKIRQVIIADKSLSTYAHNVKIITVGGMVTLKGPVRSEEEKNAIEAKAAGIVGKTNMKSEISIAPKRQINKKGGKS